jgi:hypothetical protein
MIIGMGLPGPQNAGDLLAAVEQESPTSGCDHHLEDVYGIDLVLEPG